MIRPILCIVIAVACCSSAVAQKLAAAPTKIDPKLPNVLLIGDSISIGTQNRYARSFQVLQTYFVPTPIVVRQLRV